MSSHFDAVIKTTDCIRCPSIPLRVHEFARYDADHLHRILSEAEALCIASTPEIRIPLEVGAKATAPLSTFSKSGGFLTFRPSDQGTYMKNTRLLCGRQLHCAKPSCFFVCKFFESSPPLLTPRAGALLQMQYDLANLQHLANICKRVCQGTFQGETHDNLVQTALTWFSPEIPIPLFPTAPTTPATKEPCPLSSWGFPPFAPFTKFTP